MLDDYGFEVFENNQFPFAYLITFRTYGTWLHGDKRHSVDRHGKNIYERPDIFPNKKLRKIMEAKLRHSPFVFNEKQRKLVDLAIRTLCDERGYYLRALDVRSNHPHAVVSAQKKPERIADSFKAFSSKKLRRENLVDQKRQIWSRGRSRRYLWKPRYVNLAVEYVLYGQGDIPFDLED